MSDKFDARPYLRKLEQRRKVRTARGEYWETIYVDYLDVQWRVVWFRNDHPDGEIRCEFIDRPGEVSLFKAMVSIPGGGYAEAYKAISGNVDNAFEKAQTQAVGRALALLGYGTQFCGLELGGDEMNVADAADAGVDRSSIHMPASPQGDTNSSQVVERNAEGAAASSLEFVGLEIAVADTGGDDDGHSHNPPPSGLATAPQIVGRSAKDGAVIELEDHLTTWGSLMTAAKKTLGLDPSVVKKLLAVPANRPIAAYGETRADRERAWKVLADYARAQDGKA